MKLLFTRIAAVVDSSPEHVTLELENGTLIELRGGLDTLFDALFPHLAELVDQPASEQG